MTTAGKSCTPSYPSEHHGFFLFYTIIFRADSNLPRHPFLSSSRGWDLDKTVIWPIRQVVPRSSIRGFKDDYYHVDTVVVVTEGEVHLGRKAVSNFPHFRVHG